MGFIAQENIAGVYIDGHQKLLCIEHFEGDLHEVNIKDILTHDEVDSMDGLYYCDVDGEVIGG